MRKERWWLIVWVKKETEGSIDFSNKLVYQVGPLVTYLPWGSYQLVSLRESRKAYSCHSWLIYKELLDACPSQWTPDSVFLRPDWSGLILSGFPCPGALSTQSLPTESHSDQILHCPMQHPTLQLSTPLHTALIFQVFLWPGIIFHSLQDWDRRDHSTPPKEIWLERSSTRSKYDGSVFAGASQHVPTLL